jgi:hypothetical protein
VTSSDVTEIQITLAVLCTGCTADTSIDGGGAVAVHGVPTEKLTTIAPLSASPATTGYDASVGPLYAEQPAPLS